MFIPKHEISFFLAIHKSRETLLLVDAISEMQVYLK